MRRTTARARRQLTTIGLLLVLAVLAAACGARLSDEDRALAVSGGGARTGVGSGGGGVEFVEEDFGNEEEALVDAELETADTAPAEVEVSGGDGGPEGPQDAGGEQQGGGGGGAQPGEQGGQGGGAGASGACRPSSGNAPGVSQNEIRVGNVSTISGPIPNFGATGVAGVRAYFNMVNAQGGVCGRKLTLVTGDDRLQAAANRSETEKLSDQVLAFVGSTTVTDDGGAPIIDAKEIPDISLAIADARVRSPFSFSPSPIDVEGGRSGTDKIFRHMASTYKVSRAAIVYPEQATAKQRALEYRRDFERAGIEVVEEFSVAVTETNFSSQVNRMRSQDVDFVITALEVNGMANLARAFDQAGWFPKVAFYGAQVYGKRFLEIAGRAAEGTTVGINFAIAEDAGNNPAIGAFAEWYRRSNPNADADFFAIMGWTAADMFVTALRGAGADPTRASLLAELRKLSPYDGNGLVGRIDPVKKIPGQCFMVVKVENGKWRREFPGQGFQC